MTGELTQKQIGNETFELDHISAERAAQLYTALGAVKDATGQPTKTNYQQLADQVSAVVVNYQSVVSVELPAGMDPVQATKNFMAELQKNSGKLSDTADTYLKQMMDTPYGKSLQETGAYQTAEGVANAIGAVTAFGKGFGKGLMLPITAYDSLKTGKKDAINWLDGKLNPLSKQEADSIGAVYAAAVYSAVDAPGAPEDTKRPDTKDAGIGDKIWAGLGFAGDHVAEFFRTAFAFVSNGIKGQGWDWGKAKADVLAESGPALSYQDRLAKNISGASQEKARTTAAETLAQVEEVAGVSTKKLSSLVKHGGIYRDNDGNWNSLTFDNNGAPKSEKVDMGKPGADNHATALFGGLAIGGGLSVYGTYRAAQGFGKGFAYQAVGEGSTPARVINEELKAANQYYAKSELYKTGRPAVEGGFWKRVAHPEIKADAAKAEKFLNKAQAAVNKIDVDAVEHSATRLAQREHILGQTRMGEKTLELAEAETPGFLQKIGRGFGRASGWCAEKLGINTVEKVTEASSKGNALTRAYDWCASKVGFSTQAAPTVEMAGAAAAARTVGKGNVLLSIVPDAVDYGTAVVNGDVHAQTKAATSMSITGSCAAAGFALLAPTIFGAPIGAAIGACAGGIISWFIAEPTANYLCGKKEAAPVAAKVPATEMHPGLAAATTDTTVRTQNAQKEALRPGQVFAIKNVKQTSMGALNGTSPAVPNIPGQQPAPSLHLV